MRRVALALLFSFGMVSPAAAKSGPGASVGSHAQQVKNQAQQYYLRGQAEARAGQNAAAIADFEQSIKLDPDRSDTLDALDGVLFKDRQWATSVQYWAQYIQLHPNDAHAYCQQGAGYSWLHDSVRAMADADKACSLGDQNCCQTASNFRAHHAPPPTASRREPSPRSGNNRFFGFFMAVAGVFVYLKGFKLYRKYRYLLDTVTSTAQGVAMGFVRVTGRAVGEQKLTSPVHGVPCFYYAVRIETIEESVGEPKTDSEAVKFFLEDETGRVLVDPTGLEPRSVPFLGSRQVILQGGQIPELLARAKSRAEGSAESPHPPTDLEAYTANFLASFLESHPGSVTAKLDLYHGFTALVKEWAIAEGKKYTITGTCLENRHPTEGSNMRMISKGRENAIFTVSDETAETRRSQQLKHARVFTWGGGVLSVSGLATLLYPATQWMLGLFLPAGFVSLWLVLKEASQMWQERD